MSECISDEALAAWASGETNTQLAGSIKHHISTCAACRTVVAEVSRTTGQRPQPQLLGRYELKEPIGTGGMGVVFAAWDPAVGRQVAVKLLHDAARDGHRYLRNSTSPSTQPLHTEEETVTQPRREAD